MKTHVTAAKPRVPTPATRPMIIRERQRGILADRPPGTLAPAGEFTPPARLAPKPPTAAGARLWLLALGVYAALWLALLGAATLWSPLHPDQAGEVRVELTPDGISFAPVTPGGQP